MTALAEVRKVSKKFGDFTAVDAVHLGVGQGEIVGLIGANGAGKTTLIRLLLGLLVPDGGSVELFGSAPAVAARRRVGYVPQTLGLYGDLTVAENWHFTTDAFGHRPAKVPVAIAAWEHDLVRALPLGAQRQVAFDVALSHKPELLVLDEPTSGVGPLGRARLWERIRAATDDGVGALVTTHNLEEAEQCDRLVVMVDGSVAAAGTVAEIVSGRSVVEVRSAAWERAFAVLDGSALPTELHGDALRVDAQETTVRRLLVEAQVEAGIEVVDANLEEAFVQIVSSSGAP